MEMKLQKMVKVILQNIFKTKKFMLTELSPELQTAQASKLPVRRVASSCLYQTRCTLATPAQKTRVIVWSVSCFIRQLYILWFLTSTAPINFYQLLTFSDSDSEYNQRRRSAPSIGRVQSKEYSQRRRSSPSRCRTPTRSRWTEGWQEQYPPAGAVRRHQFLHYPEESVCLLQK